MIYKIIYFSVAAFVLTRLVPDMSDGGGMRKFLFFSSIIIAPILFWWLDKMHIEAVTHFITALVLPASLLIAVIWVGYTGWYIVMFWPFLLGHILILNLLVAVLHFWRNLPTP